MSVFKTINDANFSSEDKNAARLGFCYIAFVDFNAMLVSIAQNKIGFGKSGKKNGPAIIIK